MGLPNCSLKGNSNLLPPNIDKSLQSPNTVISLARTKASNVAKANTKALPKKFDDHSDKPTYANANASAISDRDKRHILVLSCADLDKECQL